jgi:hypothetical protein
MGEAGPFEGKGGRQVEVDEHRAQRGSEHHDVAGVDVLVNDAAPMDLGDRVGQPLGQSDQLGRRQRTGGQQLGKSLAPDVLEQDRAGLRVGREVLHHTRYAGEPGQDCGLAPQAALCVRSPQLLSDDHP